MQCIVHICTYFSMLHRTHCSWAPPRFHLEQHQDVSFLTVYDNLSSRPHYKTLRLTIASTCEFCCHFISLFLLENENHKTSL
ncbi:hypothetical protein C8Q69DRAFT_38403 [Paecilomyces variotii]|uniref:Uncharacterized protein n=1 Tax=Byssochlamys spectabilis TaxID=264951 RepID=A0A443I6W6_BYSSP|nr:hypothetical protein C8Q69DRAFT_38403 [Paecilomyces variotii]RWQ99849.1 hypothetical protein C8Q69DRAFT_38403 [Paecilomyces variotii]